MKKLALATVGVAIVLIGFVTVLYCLPCINGCHGDRDACEMKDGKCADKHEGCANGNTCPKDQGGCKMEGMENGGCKMGEKESGGCKMGEKESGGCKMEGMETGGCKMEGANQGCCCCCKMMMMMMNGCQAKCDSMKKDSVRCKVRSKM